MHFTCAKFGKKVFVIATKLKDLIIKISLSWVFSGCHGRFVI